MDLNELCHYECCKCKKQFTSFDKGPGTVCLFCGHLWIAWLNFKKLFGYEEEN